MGEFSCTDVSEILLNEGNQYKAVLSGYLICRNDKNRFCCWRSDSQSVGNQSPI